MNCIKNFSMMWNEKNIRRNSVQKFVASIMVGHQIGENRPLMAIDQVRLHSGASLPRNFRIHFASGVSKRTDFG
jgi:hypothetical protein